jgi:Tol biopolymer transport system component
MRFSGRAVLCVIVLLGATGAFKSCSDDADSGGEDPPRTADDIVEVTATAATSIAVLNNDQDLDNEPLTFAIDEAPTVGTASFNSDNTVRLDLPTGFQGVTRFKYKVTNSLGGFSVSTAVVFVDVDSYRVLFAAQNSAQNFELYVSDLVSAEAISQATSGNLRLQEMWRSTSGALIAYERADPAQAAATAELFYVKTNPIADPVKIPQPAGRAFVAGAPVAVSPDDRWLAFSTTSSSNAGQSNGLYALDTGSSGAPVLVGFSAGLQTDSIQWAGDDQPALYFMASPPGISGPAVFRATAGNFDSPERVSPVYSAGDSFGLTRVSPDQTQLVLFATRGGQGGQNGAFLVETSSPNTERRLTTDMPANAVIESFEIDENFTQLTYLWRVGTGAAARLSVVPISTTGSPRTVTDADIARFSGLRPDDAAALITRSGSGSQSDGDLYEVSLDGSAADLQVASNVTGGVFDDTGDRVYLFSETLAPSVIGRSDFDRDSAPLVRSSTSASALFVTPLMARSAAILEDATAGLVLVNAAAPGKTLRLTTLAVGTVPSFTLLPTAIVASP